MIYSEQFELNLEISFVNQTSLLNVHLECYYFRQLCQIKQVLRQFQKRTLNS